MVRASKLAWMGVSVGLALTPGAVFAQGPSPTDSVEVAPAQVPPSRVRTAMRTATECYRRGDYDLAAQYFQTAQAGQNELTANERQDLSTWLNLNNTALRARREGANQLRQVEEAMGKGQTQDAQAALKAATTNRAYLTPADKQRLQNLTAQVTPGQMGTALPTGSPSAASLAQARSKVKQARSYLTSGNFDAASALAIEADHMGATWQLGEDTPRKVLEDVDQARHLPDKAIATKDPKIMLGAARTCMVRGDLDSAERLAREADKQTSIWGSMGHMWGDSPSKVLKEVQAARAKQVVKASPKTQDAKVTLVDARTRDSSTATSGNSTDSARRMIREARQALASGNTAQARELAEKARSMKPDLNWWEDNPDKVFADIQRREGAKPAADKKGALAESKPEDPHALLKQAREMYAAGKYEEANKLALRADAVKNADWGLFEGTPEKLLGEIRRARFKHDQEESVHVLAEARKLYEQGNLPEAERMAHKAQQMHGSYNFWDLGDRPNKLLAEIDVAKSKNRGVRTPAATEVAKTTPASPPAPKPVAPPPVFPSGVAERATTVVQNTPPTAPAPNMTTTVPAAPQPSVSASMPPVPSMNVATAGMENGKKMQAQLLLTQARQLQKEGRLIEARQKAMESQAVGASFSPSEDRPELALLAVSALCQQRIEHLVREANDYASSANADPTRCDRAQTDLAQAKQLAMTFGFDTQLIDAKVAWVQQVRGSAAPTLVPETKGQVAQASLQQAPTPGSPQGKNLLNQARMELRAGQTVNARRLAEAAFDPQFGVQAEAASILRSIDAEEFNQRVLTASRSFDAAVAAFNRGDYPQSATMFRSLDSQLLAADKQARLKDILQSPEMQPGAVVQTGGLKPVISDVGNHGQAVATDMTSRQVVTPEADFAKQVAAMQEVKFQKLRQDGLDAQKESMKLFQAGDTDRALEVLQEYNAGLRDSGLDGDRVAMLRRPVDSRLQQLKTLKHQRDFEKLQASQQDANQKQHLQKLLGEENQKKQLTQLMKQYNSFFKEGKYKEAEMYAMRAHELDPDDPVSGAAVYTARTMAAQVKFQKTKDRKEDHVVTDLTEAEDLGPVVNNENPLVFDTKVSTQNRDRKSVELNIGSSKNEKEREIYRRLDAPISSLDFKETPLEQVLDDLQGWTGLNIVTDKPALDEAAISLKCPVTMKLENIALKSALNLLLHQAHLTYVVKDEVLQVTTENQARGKLVTRLHPVLDLVVPIENLGTAVSTAAMNKMAADKAQYEQPSVKLGNNTPILGMNSLQGGKDVSLASMASNPPSGASMSSVPMVTKENPRGTTEDVLIKLITNAVSPQSWANVGGQGTIDFFPLGMALVINQTPDIQEQVAELLTALRRLQDQEVAVEIRFITIAESFYERIGLDFNINFRTDNTKFEPQIVSQQFRPFGFINHFSPNNFISGLTPGGAGGSAQSPGTNFTQDLNIPVHTSSFNMAVPPFGEFPNIPGSNGGVSMGLAFLSDIEVFLFMEAAQGDQRTNVMQAPKLTLFNGQTSTLTVNDQQFFVTSVTVVQAGGQVIFVPNNNQIITGGVNLTLNAVISADRRFVRLSIVPTLTNLASANVPLFPITTFITPIFEGGAVGQPVPFTQFIQQPAVNTITVNTTVNVPDGGTVLLGGLKRLSEGRNEFGPPILSKIPYLNRLFKNVGYGRETESLLMMVTPRIIINEEEELRQVPGALATPGAPQ